MQYPKWLYHKSEAPKIVESKEEHSGLGKEWTEAPMAHEVPPSEEALIEKPKRKRKSELV